MPLNQQVSFKTRLQRWSKLQVPKNERVHYNIEPFQLLKVTIKPYAVWGSSQTFHSKMREDGRIDIPKLIMDLLNSKPLRENCILEVTLEPA